jgi:hypothetical protein
MVGKWLTEERSYNAIQIRYDLARQHPTQLTHQEAAVIRRLGDADLMIIIC